MSLPIDHPLRIELNQELHARPPEPLEPSLRLTFLALYSAASQRPEEEAHIARLAQQFGVPPPPAGATHYSADFGSFRLKWERHTEFARYKFIVTGAGEDPFAPTALEAVPADWLARLPGEMLVGTHVALLPGSEAPRDYDALAVRHFDGNVLVGASIAGGAGIALTDFRIHDRFARMLVYDHSMTLRQTGRMVQRLLEIDTYRAMALLTLPIARELTPWLTQAEQELAEISSVLVHCSEDDEPALLDRLTKLDAEIESRESQHHYRFSAADAYYDLVQQRIAELREQRIQGLQNFQEFVQRRLAPAIATCRATSGRLDSLSERVARATQLLSTRVDLSRERQNQQLLESMNRRAAAQLRLQQTVEGLSVAAITYYIVGLVGYAAKGLKAAGVALNDNLVMGLSIPVVAFIVWRGVRRVRRAIGGDGH